MNETGSKKKKGVEEELSIRKKIIIGGLGGITPVLMNLLVVDLDVLLIQFTIVALIGYLIRVIILFYLGGIVAFLNKGVNDPVKLFQFGIVAPAMLTAFINGTNIDVPQMPASTLKSEIQITSIAYADNASVPITVKAFSPPRQSFIQQLLRGLIGSRPRNVWFVIAGSHKSLKNAEQQAEKIRKKGFKTEVYRPFGNNPYYSVVIGSHLSQKGAEKLRQKAVEKGLPKDTYLWTFPKEN